MTEKDYGYLDKPASPGLWSIVLGGALLIVAVILFFLPKERTEAPSPPELNRESYEHIISELHRENDARKDSIVVLMRKCRRLR